MFLLSLTGEAKTWLNELNKGTIETWYELQTAFISRFFTPAFSQHENETLTEAWLRMKEMLRNCHGHNLSKGNIINIFYHGLNEITQEVLNAASGGQMDAMTMKMDARYKEFQSRSKQPNLDHDNDDTPMSREEEEAKFMKTFRHTRFYNDYRDRDSNRDNWQIEEDNKVPLILGRHFLYNADAVIRVKHKQLNLRVGTILEEKLFAEFDEFMAMTAEENSDSESNTKEPPFEKITFNTNYKIKTSAAKPLMDLELKPLLDNLEHAFLEESSFLLVIISSQLSEENKNKIVSVLKNHKQAFS
nr:hypothetical protein [Tanacetum cinerariifolium]